MTEEQQQIQDARTEWLLLWGYKVVSWQEVWVKNPLFLSARDNAWEATREVWDANIITDDVNCTYQLRELIND